MSGKENVIELQWPDLFKTISGLKTAATNKIVIEREVIPIIFIPGIMGSRLRQKGGDKAWDPDAKYWMVKNMGLLSPRPAKRKKLLVGRTFNSDYLEVISKSSDRDNEYSDHNKKHYEPVAGSADRGWDEVSASSYGAFLKTLQSHVWSEPVRHCFDFPVHVKGYNWTDSNLNAGKKLKEYIDQVITEYSNKGRKCEKVLLVTHSMGGLVARSACMLHNASSKVLGVVHGVQPAMGAPAAYWRMKGGFERPGEGPPGSWKNWLTDPLKMAKRKFLGPVTSRVLGINGEEVTALLGNMPGGLELLPNKLYTSNAGSKQWLIYPSPTAQAVRLPQSNPYSEIYREKTKFYRLIEPEWLDPGIAEGTRTKRRIKNKSWRAYDSCLQKAEKFHDRLKDKVHSQTVQFHSEGLLSSDKILYERELNQFSTRFKHVLSNIFKAAPGKAIGGAGKAAIGMKAFTYKTAVLTVGKAIWDERDASVNQGGYRAYADESDDRASPDDKERAVYMMTLQRPNGSGDGTVPYSSAKALTKALETVGIGDEESWLVRDHEPVYHTHTAQHITFSAIENFCLDYIKKATGS